MISTALIALVSLETLGWRWYLVLCTAPYVIVLILRILWKYESPRYLLVSGHPEKATEIIKIIAQVNKRVPPEGELSPIQNVSHTKGRITDLLSKVKQNGKNKINKINKIKKIKKIQKNPKK